MLTNQGMKMKSKDNEEDKLRLHMTNVIFDEQSCNGSIVYEEGYTTNFHLNVITADWSNELILLIVDHMELPEEEAIRNRTFMDLVIAVQSDYVAQMLSNKILLKNKFIAVAFKAETRDVSDGFKDMFADSLLAINKRYMAKLPKSLGGLHKGLAIFSPYIITMAIVELNKHEVEYKNILHALYPSLCNHVDNVIDNDEEM